MMKRIFSTISVSLFFSFLLVGQTDRTVVIEHFTNTRCSICASKNPAFYDLLSNYPSVLHIAYHPSQPYSNCAFSEHNPTENDDRTIYYNVYGGTPRVVVQGEVVASSTPLLNGSRIDTELGQTSPFSIEVNQSVINDDSVAVQIIVSGESGHAFNMLNLYVIVVEETVYYNAPNGENVHHDVFRLALTPANGSSFSVPQVGQQESFDYTYRFSNDWNNSEMYVAAILSDGSSKEIIQASRSSKVGSVTRISDEHPDKISHVFFPNPFTDEFVVQFSEKLHVKSIELADLSGKKIYIQNQTQTSDNQQIKIHPNLLSPGLYILKIQTNKGLVIDKVYKR